ncbi:MAG: hypothetical protein AAF657_32950 [Acidobacteriota bacterium]
MADPRIELLAKLAEQTTDDLGNVIQKVKRKNIEQALLAIQQRLLNTIEELDTLLGDPTAAVPAAGTAVAPPSAATAAATTAPGAGLEGVASGGTGTQADKPLKIDLGQFMTDVGQSVIGAQGLLDQQAKQAMRSGSQDMPTLYRIPKLSAEVRFAVENVENKGVNILFYKNVNTAQQEHQQSVQFDLVAVPPPPELLAELRSAAPSLQLVLDPTIRSSLFAAVEEAAAPAGPTATAFRANRKVLLDHRSQVISVGSGDNSYLLFYANREAEKNLGIWSLTLGPPPVLDEIYRFTVNGTFHDQQRLRDFIADLGQQQATFLAS